MPQQAITTEYAFQLIDKAAQENKLYHYNGGQAYIRPDMSSDTLVIVDHTNANDARYSIEHGANYFKACEGYNIEHSKRLREYGSLLNWYNNTQKVG